MTIGTRHFVAALLAIALGSCGSGSRSETAPPPATAAAPESLPPLERPPIDSPVRVTATFGEYRRGHFHAGLDFSTDHRIGRPIYAPVTGWIARARTSGAGFGRSLMIHTEDGRTILLAHLDAFDEPIASYVAAAQDSTGQYEQELSPPPHAIPVQAGQRIAWSGESGAGPPHLHMEVRYGDLAYNPLRHGLALPDSSPPVLSRVFFEPIDDASFVEGTSAPRGFSLPADTVVIDGRVRVWVEAADGVTDSWPRDAPYALSLAWKGESVECRFDRIAWNADMSAVEWVYDGRGAISSRHAVSLWAAPEFRPMVLSGPATSSGTGVIVVAAGDSATTLTLAARDAAGNRTEQRLVVRPRADRDAARWSSPRGVVRRARAWASRGFELSPVQGPFVRITYGGAPSSDRDVTLGLSGERLESRPAQFVGGRWTAVVRVPSAVSAWLAKGTGAAGPWERREPLRLVALSPESTSVTSGSDEGSSFRWSFPRMGVFAPAWVVAESLHSAPQAPGLVAYSAMTELAPAGWPLRRPVRIESRRTPGEHRGLYVQYGGAWTLAQRETTGGAAGEEVEGGATTLGRAAFFEDVLPPRVGLARAVRIATPAPSRWALQCSIVEHGSGIDVTRTRFVVDGKPVPSEWDAEHGVLRWRPLAPPPPGTHRYEISATDRAGWESRSTGNFVVRSK